MYLWHSKNEFSLCTRKNKIMDIKFRITQQVYVNQYIQAHVRFPPF